MLLSYFRLPRAHGLATTADAYSASAWYMMIMACPCVNSVCILLPQLISYFSSVASVGETDGVH